MKREWRAGLAVLAVGCALALGGMLMAAGHASQADPADDLAVVRKAVGEERATVQERATGVQKPPAAGPEPSRREVERRPPVGGKEPTWLKVRVVEKGSGKKKVTVNVPIAVVRAFGDGWPVVRFDCGDRETRCSLRLSEILATLEAGQELVEVDDEHQVVRVWVE